MPRGFTLHTRSANTRARSLKWSSIVPMRLICQSAALATKPVPIPWR
jgi:hypothetical protein